MRFSTKGAGIAVTVIFAAAATFVPLSVSASWRPLVGSVAWVAVILACYVYLEAHVDSLARFRHNFQKTYPVLMLSIAFLVCGCLGIGVFALFKANEPKADAAATTEPPNAAKNGPILAEKSAGRQSTPAPRHINTATVLEIHKELELAGPLERDEVAEQFRHGIVDWTLIFYGDLIRPRGTDLMTVRFLPVNSPYPKITCPNIKVEGNAYLGRIRSPTRFRVRGVIGDIDLNWFTLHEATFEQLSDATPTPTPLREEGPKVVPPKQVEPKPKPVKSGVTNEEIFSLFNKGDTSLKVSRALEPYVGTVITIDGKLIQIHGGSGGGPIALSMRVNNGPGTSCVFDAKWLDHLDALKRDQEIRVRGKIRPEPAGNDLQLIECELLGSGAAAIPSPTAKNVLDRLKIRDTPDGAVLVIEDLPTPTPSPIPNAALSPKSEWPVYVRADIAALKDFKLHRDKGEHILSAIQTGDSQEESKWDEINEWWTDAQAKAYQDVFSPFLTLGALNRFGEPWPEVDVLDACERAIHKGQITDRNDDVEFYATHWRRLERVRELIGIIEFKA